MVFRTLIGIIALICAIWVIYDVLVENENLTGTGKVIWIIAALLFSILTAILYYLIEKR